MMFSSGPGSECQEAEFEAMDRVVSSMINQSQHRAAHQVSLQRSSFVMAIP